MIYIAINLVFVDAFCQQLTDDEKDIRRALNIYLSGEGYAVCEVASGAEAVVLPLSLALSDKSGSHDISCLWRGPRDKERKKVPANEELNPTNGLRGRLGSRYPPPIGAL